MIGYPRQVAALQQHRLQLLSQQFRKGTQGGRGLCRKQSARGVVEGVGNNENSESYGLLKRSSQVLA